MGKGENDKPTIEEKKDASKTNLYIESKLKSINSAIK